MISNEMSWSHCWQSKINLIGWWINFYADSIIKMDHEFLFLASISVHVCVRRWVTKWWGSESNVQVWYSTETDSLQTQDKWGDAHRLHTDINTSSTITRISPWLNCWTLTSPSRLEGRLQRTEEGVCHEGQLKERQWQSSIREQVKLNERLINLKFGWIMHVKSKKNLK